MKTTDPCLSKLPSMHSWDSPVLRSRGCLSLRTRSAQTLTLEPRRKLGTELTLSSGVFATSGLCSPPFSATSTFRGSKCSLFLSTATTTKGWTPSCGTFYQLPHCFLAFISFPLWSILYIAI